jgi:NAD(P)-dependent dehydrogenase (short-subunit alcohol dehydrogenase family)
MGRVKGKVALVTGAARGIGEACARLLAKEGAQVMLSDLDRGTGSAVVESIRREGGQADFFQQDVADESSWPAVLEATLRCFGSLDILVNNAGIALLKNVEQTSMADWRRMMSVNLDAVFMGTKHCIPAMAGRNASIVNISSIEGLVGDAMLAAYNASKGGVRLFTKSAALHCARKGLKIRVNSVHPGSIWTPMVETYLKELGGDLEKKREAVGRQHPLGTLGEPIDVAYGVLYLASDESKFVTGSELVIDGGYTAQ